ncbi:MAG: SAM-dependent methyltransferase [Burkholderiaceae bacterium]
MPATPALPEPDRAQLAVSQRLAAVLAEAIAAAGGWIGFDDWMARALYTPALGYYAGGARKFGAAGDFVTAPELSPVFGQCLAAQCRQWFGHGVPTRIFEFGAGSGALAATLIEALAGAGCGPIEYRIVELSAALRARQRETLAQRVPEAFARVTWLDELPGSIEGVVIGNELLDAMPVRLFRLDGGQVFERGVGCTGGPAPRFAFSERPAAPDFAAAVQATLAASGWATGGGWPDGYCSELGEQAPAWVASVGERLRHGALLLIDYGFPRAEYYHPQRSQGTLICHYRHRAHDDPLRWPGLQDITAHVDFSAIDEAARGAGLAPLGYAAQAGFLIGCGLAQLAMQVSPADAAAWARQAAGLQKLVSEAEMGELFKAIAWGRGLPDDAIGFADSDRRAALERPAC